MSIYCFYLKMDIIATSIRKQLYSLWLLGTLQIYSKSYNNGATPQKKIAFSPAVDAKAYKNSICKLLFEGSHRHFT